MSSDQLIRLPCKITRGGFPSERVFRLLLADGSVHVGAAPIEYLFTADRTRLGPDVPTQKGVSIPGFVTARIVAVGPAETVLVSVPSGEVLRVNADAIGNHSAEAPSDVPVKS
jgi:hypothetical protein